MHPSHGLLHTTVRLEADLGSGMIATGTGFYFRFVEKPDGQHCPAIVTNKHVVQGAESLTFVISLGDENNNPCLGRFERVCLPKSSLKVVSHPLPEVDLCAILLGPVISWFQRHGKNTGIIAVSKSLIADPEFLSNIFPLEDVVMVGYPNGIWDSTNNSPVGRRGVIATNPQLDYEGRPEFVIDMACFPGSSGSPVYIYNFGHFTDKTGNLSLGSRIKLIGVLYAGPVHTAEGEIRTVPIPTTNVSTAISRIPNNLGYVIKAFEIFEIEKIIEQMFS